MISGLDPLPENISVQDLVSGNVDIDRVLKEVSFLQNEIATMRHEMVLFIRSFSAIEDTANQRLFYDETVKKVKNLQERIEKYCRRYNKIIPLVNHAQSAYGIEPESTQTPQLSKKKAEPTPKTKSLKDNHAPVLDSSSGTVNQPILL